MHKSFNIFNEISLIKIVEMDCWLSTIIPIMGFLSPTIGGTESEVSVSCLQILIFYHHIFESEKIRQHVN